MIEALLFTLIIVLYFVGGAAFSVAYVRGYPQDKKPNLGMMTLFWVFIAIFHVLFQLVHGIDGTVGKLARRFNDEEPPQRSMKRRPPQERGVYKDRGPGTS